MTNNNHTLEILHVLKEASLSGSILEASKKLNVSNKQFIKWSGFSVQELEDALRANNIKKLVNKESSECSNNVTIRFQRMLRSNLPDTIIKYSFFNDSAFGPGLIASTDSGVCFLGFDETANATTSSILYKDLKKRYFEAACFQEESTKIHLQIIDYLKFEEKNKDIDITVNILGTDFQFEVWKELTRIPKNKLTTYSKIGINIAKPKSFRAIGTTIGKNPIAYFIPCHRVISADGNIGNFRWGSNVKMAMIGWESLN